MGRPILHSSLCLCDRCYSHTKEDVKPFRPFRYLTLRDVVWDNYLVKGLYMVTGMMVLLCAEMRVIDNMIEPHERVWRSRKQEEKTKEELEEDLKRSEGIQHRRMRDLEEAYEGHPQMMMCYE